MGVIFLLSIISIKVRMFDGFSYAFVQNINSRIQIQHRGYFLKFNGVCGVISLQHFGICIVYKIWLIEYLGSACCCMEMR